MSKEIGPPSKIFHTPSVRRISRDEQRGDTEEFKKQMQEQVEEEEAPPNKQSDNPPEPLLEEGEEHEPGEAGPGVGVNLDIST